MIKVIYSKKTGKCDIGRINDKGDIFKEVRKMRYWTPVINDKGDIFKEERKMRYWIVLMIKVIYSKKSGKCDIGRLY